jgi:conjugative relaxase-like TrwC/TraI family protein
VDLRRRPDAVTALLADTRAWAAVDDITLGEQAWSQAAAAAGRHVPVGNAGYELTLTVPKSISLHALTGDPRNAEAWFEVMEAAATQALEQLMAEAGFCSTGHRGDGQDVRIVPADGWAGFIATEISSRAGDPHLHVHCTLPNVLVGRDGVVRTMADGGRELIVNAPRFAARGQAHVVAEAKARGLIDDAWFDPVSWQWQAGRFSDDTIAAFSRGRQRVLAGLADADDGRPVTAKVRSRRDRAVKAAVTGGKDSDQPSWSRMAATVAHRAHRFGLDLQSERAGTEPGYAQPEQWSDDTWVALVTQVACEHDSTATLAKVRALVDLDGAGLPSEERLRITRLVLDRGFVRGHESHDRGMRTGGQAWVSRPALAAEQWLLDAVGQQSPTALPDDGLAWQAYQGLAAQSVSMGWQLTGEQVHAAHAIARGTAPITLIAGVAGSGKTTVLQAARLALEADRRRMLVVSTATIAAAKAGHESGAPWMNLTALRRAIEAGVPPRVSVIVLDEASMADVVSVQRIAAWCRETGKRLVLQGDPAQLGAVAAGDAFSVLCRTSPEQVLHLTTNMRQRTDDGQVIARALHSGDVATAWARLGDTGAVLVARNREHKLTLLTGLVADQIAAHGPDAVTCDAVTNAEVDDLNERIHDRLVDRGLVDPATVRTYRTPGGDMCLGEGTVLRVTRPLAAARGDSQLARGERVTVVEAGRERVRVRTADGTERSMTPRTLLRHTGYGYVGTTHKVQGQTSEVHIASIDPHKDRQSLYVTATRARERTVLVADARDWLNPSEMARAYTWPTGQVDDEVMDRIRTHLEGRAPAIDSPSGHLRPTLDGPAPPGHGIAG